MFHKVKLVDLLSDHELSVTFTSGEVRVYDVKPLIEKYDRFRPLEDEILFRQVTVDTGGYGIVWNDDIDISAGELYENGCCYHFRSSAIGHSWDEVEKDIFTPEEIAESNLRVAKIGAEITKLEYKGFIGSVEFSEADGVFFGSVMGQRALISYEGATIEELEKDFRAAVDDYIELCEDEYDLELYEMAMEEYRNNPVTYSMEEVERMLEADE